MHLVLLPFMALAALGLLLSIAAHVFALLGLPIPGGQMVWSLHVGIFVVWLPAVFVSHRASRGTRRSEFWKLVLSGCPRWMRNALYGLFAYAIFNFIWFIATGTTQPHAAGGAPPSVVRGFSGHWMVFYGAAFAILYSTTRKPGLLKRQRCLNGHEVSPADLYCPSCGTKVVEPLLPAKLG